MIATNPAPVLRRRIRQYTERPIAFYNPVSRDLVWERGSKSLSQDYPLSTLLQGLQHVAPGRWQLYIIGGWNAASVRDQSWYTEPLSDGATIDKYQHDPRLVSYTYKDQKFDVRLSSTWFDDSEKTWGHMMSWKILKKYLHNTFDTKATLMTTPAQTGCDLLQRSLPDGKDYPVLPEDIRTIIRQNSPQGRIQFFPQPGAIPALYNLDGRWMYAACVRDLPGRLAALDKINEYVPYAPAMYFITAKVPADWAHIGLLPMRGDDETLYPNTPGATIHGWVWGAELHIALDHLWEVQIHERMLFSQVDPCKNWITKLRAIRDHAILEPTFGPLWSGMVRHIVLDTIGSWARQERQIQRFVPLTEAQRVPAGARGRAITTEGISWYETQPLTADQEAWMHPEWSGLVWSRARARLARAALLLPFGDIVALRTDALYTTRDPAWQDDGKPGTFRMKSKITTPISSMTTLADLLTIRREMTPCK